MIEFARLSPPYSVVMIADISGGDIPKLARGTEIAASDSCIAIGTLSEIDGETEFRLGMRGEVDPGTSPSFLGRIKTPSRKLAIFAVPGEIILQTQVLQTETAIYIWTNRPSEPDQVIVGVE
ncbi:MAG TPA: hypothetical protein VGG12_04360 [Methylovirgula sp.]